MPKKPTVRISVTIDTSDHAKIQHVMVKEKITTVSQAANRLIKEALEGYPDPDQPTLPFAGRRR